MLNLFTAIAAICANVTDPTQRRHDERGDVVQTVLMVVLGVTIAGLVSAAIVAFINGQLPLIS